MYKIRTTTTDKKQEAWPKNTGQCFQLFFLKKMKVNEEILKLIFVKNFGHFPLCHFLLFINFSYKNLAKI